jgi:hypothetical protein
MDLGGLVNGFSHCVSSPHLLLPLASRLLQFRRQCPAFFGPVVVGGIVAGHGGFRQFRLYEKQQGYFRLIHQCFSGLPGLMKSFPNIHS